MAKRKQLITITVTITVMLVSAALTVFFEYFQFGENAVSPPPDETVRSSESLHERNSEGQSSSAGDRSVLQDTSLESGDTLSEPIDNIGDIPIAEKEDISNILINPITIPADESSNSSEFPGETKRDILQAFVKKRTQEFLVGDFFYDIPEIFRAGSSSVIRVGVADKVTRELLERFNIEETAKTLPASVKYEPLGTDIELWVSDGAKIEPIGQVGTKAVIPNNEPIWRWSVTPQKTGKHTVIVTVKVEVSLEGSEDTFIFDFEAYSKEHEVNRNLSYSLGTFFSKNQAQIIGLVLAPGSLGALLTWMFVRQQEKKRKALADAKALEKEPKTRTIGFLADRTD